MKTELFAGSPGTSTATTTRTSRAASSSSELERDFGLGAAEAAEVADALDRFSTLENTKRAEYWGTQNPSGVNSAAFNGSYSFPLSPTADGDELQRYLDEANALVAILDDVSARLGERYRSAFYQQVLHRVRSYRNQAEQIGYYWKNQRAAEQRRYGSATIYAALSKASARRIRDRRGVLPRARGRQVDRRHRLQPPDHLLRRRQRGHRDARRRPLRRRTSASDGVGASAEGRGRPAPARCGSTRPRRRTSGSWSVFNRKRRG